MNVNGTEIYNIGIITFFVLIMMIVLLWKVRKNHIEYYKYKKNETKEAKATITSFEGGGSRYSFYKYTYSYRYNIDDKTYSRKFCKLKEIYNKGDTINIFYIKDNPEDSITEEEYNEITLMRDIGYLILLGISLIAFVFLIYLSSK